MSVAGTSGFCAHAYLQHNQPTEAVRYKYQRAKWVLLAKSAATQNLRDRLNTFRFRTKARSSRLATFEAFCRIAPSPNHCDWYPYLMMRALGAASGSMSFSSSQFTHRGFSAVPTFLHQLSSGCAPMPWIATMLA